MDVFLITSFLEGLCISAIESQTAGLPTFVSTGVPKECVITDLIYRISLEESPEEWAHQIIKRLPLHTRKDCANDIINSGYDIKEAAIALQSLYCGEIDSSQI